MLKDKLLFNKINDNIPISKRALSIYNNRGGDTGFAKGDREELTKLFRRDTEGLMDALDKLDRIEEYKEHHKVVESLSLLSPIVSRAKILTVRGSGQYDLLLSRILTLDHRLQSILSKYQSQYGHPNGSYPLWDLKKEKTGLSNEELAVYDPTRPQLNTKDFTKNELRNNLFEISKVLADAEPEPYFEQKQRFESLRPMTQHLWEHDEDYQPARPISVEEEAKRVWDEAVYKVESLNRANGNWYQDLQKQKQTEELSKADVRGWLDHATSFLLKDEKNRKQKEE